MFSEAHYSVLTCFNATWPLRGWQCNHIKEKSFFTVNYNGIEGKQPQKHVPYFRNTVQLRCMILPA